MAHNQVEAHHQNQEMEGRLQKSLYLSSYSAQPEQSHDLQTWWQLHAALRNNTIRFRPSGCWKCWCKRMNSDWKHWEHRKGDRPSGRSRSQISGSGCKWCAHCSIRHIKISTDLLIFFSFVITSPVLLTNDVWKLNIMSMKKMMSTMESITSRPTDSSSM